MYKFIKVFQESTYNRQMRDTSTSLNFFKSIFKFILFIFMLINYC